MLANYSKILLNLSGLCNFLYRNLIEMLQKAKLHISDLRIQEYRNPEFQTRKGYLGFSLDNSTHIKQFVT